ncbi:hypothetical protein BOTBODRAFT_173797 [Botryobasidium botryosum FD-172 SS1]|uniref:Rab-GAP TBC domain-containing protein n=1 Tax=Botryobasidium botryosum (strain FD-172 SS1) TaxID=930990 RepID=A0A067MLW8_BOTB1|nr:hypothetical protein BOTBODRAFT_173797 [Botryobasidium botryosum FD-172 SS1]
MSRARPDDSREAEHPISDSVASQERAQPIKIAPSASSPLESPTLPRSSALNLDLDDVFSTGDDDVDDVFDFHTISLRPSVAEGEEDQDVEDHGESQEDEEIEPEEVLKEVVLHDVPIPDGHNSPIAPAPRSPTASSPGGNKSPARSLSTEPRPPLPIITDIPISPNPQSPSSKSPVDTTQTSFVNVSLSPVESRRSSYVSNSASHISHTSTSSISVPVSPPLSARSNGSSHQQASQHPTVISSPSLPLPSPSLAPAPPYVVSHRPTRSAGPSTFEKVYSKTRPTHLPPKPKEEDKKHLRDWEEMMKASRLADEKRKEAAQAKRDARERAVEETQPIWEQQIIPNCRAVLRDPRLRAIWRNGVPSKLRGKVWSLAVGNGLALSKDSFRNCLARANRARSTLSFPAPTLALIEDDILNTLPNLHIFHPETGPLYQDLKDILCAWTISRADEGLGYVRGTASVAGMFLINMPPDQTFISMRNLLERHCLRSFYGGSGAKEDVEAYYRIFDTLLADGMPKVYFNFKQHHISPSLYLPDWLLPLFLNHLPFEVCTRIWDVLLLEGDAFLFRAAIGILGVMESRLFFPDRQELLEVLRGENKAALEVAKRTGINLDLSARYEQYGVTEDALWDVIEGMEEWWKESTWTRLIQRELPDL